jgi:hypothetical protein
MSLRRFRRGRSSKSGFALALPTTQDRTRTRTRTWSIAIPITMQHTSADSRLRDLTRGPKSHGQPNSTL